MSRFVGAIEPPPNGGCPARGFRLCCYGDVGDAHDEELIVRDLDLDKIAEVRNTWQFYRDRRPDAYDDLTRP